MTNTAFTHRKLGQLATFINGSAFRPSDWGNLGLPIIRIQNLNGSSDFNYYTGRRVKCVPVEPGDLLFSWSGSIGTSFGAHRWSGQAGVLNQHIFKVVPADGVNPGLLYHVLRFATSRLEQMAHGGAGLVHIKKSVLVDFEVKLPTNARHLTRVATLLDLAESAVSATDALIAAKREQKRGLMQQLLTGKVRFPGFTEPWKTVRLGDVVSVDPEQLPATTPADYLFNYIDLSSVNNGRIELPTSTTQFSSAPSRARRVLKTGDVLLSTVRPLLKGFGILTSDAGPFVGSTGFAVLRGKRQEDARFVFECLFSSPVLRQMHARTTGSSYPALGADDVRDLRIPWPSVPERDKIEALLTATTRELRLLEDSRSFLANERRGLMERLLSGDITIPSSNTSAA